MEMSNRAAIQYSKCSPIQHGILPNGNIPTIGPPAFIPIIHPLNVSAPSWMAAAAQDIPVWPFAASNPTNIQSYAMDSGGVEGQNSCPVTYSPPEIYLSPTIQPNLSWTEITPQGVPIYPLPISVAEHRNLNQDSRPWVPNYLNPSLIYVNHECHQVPARDNEGLAPSASLQYNWNGTIVSQVDSHSNQLGSEQESVDRTYSEQNSNYTSSSNEITEHSDHDKFQNQDFHEIIVKTIKNICKEMETLMVSVLPEQEIRHLIQNLIYSPSSHSCYSFLENVPIPTTDWLKLLLKNLEISVSMLANVVALHTRMQPGQKNLIAIQETTFQSCIRTVFSLLSFLDTVMLLIRNLCQNLAQKCKNADKRPHYKLLTRKSSTNKCSERKSISHSYQDT